MERITRFERLCDIFFSVPRPRVNSDLVFSVKNIFRCALHVYCMDSITLVSHRTLQVNYKASGWVVHHVSDTWAKTSALQGKPVWALWPMGGAWLCTHLWEHYAYTADKVSNLFLYLCPFFFAPSEILIVAEEPHCYLSLRVVDICFIFLIMIYLGMSVFFCWKYMMCM